MLVLDSVYRPKTNFTLKERRQAQLLEEEQILEHKDVALDRIEITGEPEGKKVTAAAIN